jgi:NADH:ubiquinone oxidoreductase subunit 6 (subunit J)
MPDFLNALLPFIFVFLGTMLVIFIARMVILRHVENEEARRSVKKAFVTIFVVAALFFGYRFFMYTAVNETPQSVIDRHDVNHQIQEFDQRVHDDRDNNND